MSSGILTQVPGLQSLLDQCQRRVRLHSTTRGLAETSIILCTSLLLACLLDYLFVLPGVARCILLTTVLLSTATVAWLRLVRPLLGRFPPEELGAAVDLRFPDLQESLATLISIHRSPQTLSDAGSAVMQQRLQQHVSQRVQAIRPHEVVNAQPVIRRATAAAVMLLLTLLPFLIWPDSSQLLLQRLLTPFANLAAPTNLYFEVQPGDHVAATGSSIPFAARPLWRNRQNGSRPQSAQLEMLAADGHLEHLPMFWDESSASFTATLV
jgi:hypothetical protein